MNDWKYLVIHHSVTADGKTFDYQAIKKYHIEVRGWLDIGYHFVVEKVNDQYEVIVGRPLTMNGAHCYQLNMNEQGIGICFVGNYDIAAPDEEMIAVAKKRIIIPLGKMFDIKWNGIIGHREVKGVTKTCPGTMFDMDAFHNSLHDELGYW